MAAQRLLELGGVLGEGGAAADHEQGGRPDVEEQMVAVPVVVPPAVVDLGRKILAA